MEKSELDLKNEEIERLREENEILRRLNSAYQKKQSTTESQNEHIARLDKEINKLKRMHENAINRENHAKKLIFKFEQTVIKLKEHVKEVIQEAGSMRKFEEIKFSSIPSTASSLPSLVVVNKDNVVTEKVDEEVNLEDEEEINSNIKKKVFKKKQSISSTQNVKDCQLINYSSSQTKEPVVDWKKSIDKSSHSSIPLILEGKKSG